MASFRRISGFDLFREGRWDPDLFCDAGAIALLAPENRQTLKQMGATCVEGLRIEVELEHANSAAGLLSGPLYQMGNLEPLRFRLDRRQWQSPTSIQHQACVDPGDVVLKKTRPVAAAWAAPGLPRHPADVGCILIKWTHSPDSIATLAAPGATRERRTLALAFWTALCLNQPEYETWLLRRSGGFVLPRISVAELRQLKFPALPPEAETLAARIWEWNEQSLESAKELCWLLDEVDEQIRQLVPDSDELETASAASWAKFFPAEDVNDALIPRHVVHGHLQHTLREQRGWVPLPTLLGPRQPLRMRCTHLDPNDRYLRLGDIGENLTILDCSVIAGATMPARVYSESIAADDVLLSLLVTNPRVAFAGVLPPGDVYAVDHWERFRFRETPGAWALVLSTAFVRRQLQLLAMGSVQQFTHPEYLRQLMLPPLDDELRLKWDRHLRRYQVRRQELRRRWHELWTESLALYHRAHPGVAQGDSQHDARRV